MTDGIHGGATQTLENASQVSPEMPASFGPKGGH